MCCKDLPKGHWNPLEKAMVNGKMPKAMNKYISFLLTVIWFVACQPNHDLGTPFQKGQEVTLTANIGEQHPQLLPGMQRVSGKDTLPTDPNNGQITLTWDEGDKILVKVGEQSSIFTLSAGAGTRAGTFTGTMPADGDSYSVQYPTTTPNLSEQQYVPNGFGKDLMRMTTKMNGTLDGGFILYADYALLGLQLTGDQQIGKIVLTNPMDNKTYTLHSINVALSSTPTLFYIVVPEGEWSQGFRVDIYANDGKTINKTLTKEGSMTFSATSATIMPTQWTTPDALDMGVSVKWATRNIGAISPEDYGDYFAWGETEPKDSYTWDNYKFGNNKDNLMKYNAQDQLTKLLMEDDAVHVNWGNNWRMPTKEEYQELIDHTTSEWITDYNGTKVYGMLFTAENGNTLFLPAAGMVDVQHYAQNLYGLYWSANCIDDSGSNFGFINSDIYFNNNPRSSGYSIRGVKEANK